jgi:tRNA (guanine-N7-)-methyltransferase
MTEGLADADAASPPPHRAIRSFVLRQGRLTGAQARALDELRPRYVLPLTDEIVDLEGVFGREADRVLEIGFGNGDALLAAALAQPERDFIGVEVHGPGVGRLLKGASVAGIDNLRVFQDDAVQVLTRAIGPETLVEVRIFFPDPWPKKKHHKRRLVQPAFVALVHRALRAGGRLHLATDWPAYADHMLEVLDAAAGYRNLAGAGYFVERPDSRPRTHFEQRGVRLGHPVHDLIFEKT